MIIYPTLEILDGKCVSLNRGRLEEPVSWHIDPVETARSFAAAGAEWMHVTDMNSLRGEGNNDALIADIIRAARIPVQLGGGFRSRERVEQWVDRGAGRIVVGTMAAQEPGWMKQLIRRFPDQIALAVDMYQGHVMTEGWRKYSALEPGVFMAAFDDEPLAAIVVTDIDADIEGPDASLSVISGLAAKTRHPVIGRGTIRSTDDVARMKYVYNVAGAMVGRALLTKDVDLKQALAVARPEPEKMAEFQ